ncbi:hypothetical protein E4634_19170 [Mangrovimicrobium sediminis]|uniref:SPOR domain-containing protein n=1 Tax=Mangrovimicrobium sediminis TaxID=2562682 RepID=A0A4Z0LVG4_9GAMM|nr:SPOR domain-containing protein [Haliea sp. SAOS-164]TGD71393.1 hypothetical protein E4634_19170 [Haliea sp. SAOS-164]
MNNVLKQRLVGALILLALGVVFWPIIFVEPGAPSGSAVREAPPPPAIDTAPVPPPDRAGLRVAAPHDEAQRAALGDAMPVDALPDANSPADTPASSAEVEEEPPSPAVAALPEPGSTRTEPPQPTALDEQDIPIAWVLQVASVSEAQRADALRAQLVELGHKAYVKKVFSGGKALYRVCIGPKVEKSRLEAIRGGIDSEFGVKSLVVRYYP